MNPDASFCEKIEKSVPYRHPRAVGPKLTRGKFGSFRLPIGTPKVPNWLLDTEHFFCVWVPFGLFFLGFFDRSLYLDVFSFSVYDFFFNLFSG